MDDLRTAVTQIEVAAGEHTVILRVLRTLDMTVALDSNLRSNLLRSGLAKKVNELFRHSNPFVVYQSHALATKWTAAIKAIKAAEAGIAPDVTQCALSPEKVKRSIGHVQGSMNEQTRKRPRSEVGATTQFPCTPGQSSCVQEVATPQRARRVVPVASLEHKEQPKIPQPVLFREERILVTIRPFSTQCNPPEVGMRKQKDDILFDIVLDWAHEHFGVPQRMLPRCAKTLRDKRIIVRDATGKDYNLEKRLVDIYDGLQCKKCQERIYGIPHVRHGLPYHFGCIDDPQECEQKSISEGVLLYIHWPDEAMPAIWFRKSTSGTYLYRECADCGSRMKFCPARSLPARDDLHGETLDHDGPHGCMVCPTCQSCTSFFNVYG